MATRSSAARAAAAGTDITFSYDGESYTIPPTERWPIDVVEAIEDGRVVRATRELLGADQWRTFRSKPRTATDLNDLFEAASDAAGIEGN